MTLVRQSPSAMDARRSITGELDPEAWQQWVAEVTNEDCAEGVGPQTLHAHRLHR